MLNLKETTQGAMYPRLKFVNKFFLYSGLTKNLDQSGSMEEFESELMKIFNCDPEWPICLYDFTYKNKVPKFFCFRIECDLTTRIIDNYFTNENSKASSKWPSSNRISSRNLVNDLLIERNFHICQRKNFVEKFKILFNSNDSQLIQSSNL
jgi:hypothetical protein